MGVLFWVGYCFCGPSEARICKDPTLVKIAKMPKFHQKLKYCMFAYVLDWRSCSSYLLTAVLTPDMRLYLYPNEYVRRRALRKEGDTK